MFIRAVRRRTAVPDICFVGVVAASVEKGPQEATPSPEKKSCGDTVGEYGIPGEKLFHTSRSRYEYF